MEILASAVLVGSVATALTDLWSLARRRFLGVPLPDFGLVGRWLTHMRHGQFRHASIAAATPVINERLIGWIAHYSIGIAFAGLLLGLYGPDWILQPRLLPALLVGLGTLAAPLLLMQPGMGVPFTARRALHGLFTHTVFGVGLYVAGWSANLLFIN